MLELTFGFIMIWILDRFVLNCEKVQWKDVPLTIGIVVMFAVICEMFNFDYGFYGIIALSITYFLKKATDFPNYIVIGFTVLPLGIMHESEWVAMSLVLIMYLLQSFCCKETQKKNGAGRYLKYLFYPGHLVLLYLFFTFVFNQ